MPRKDRAERRAWSADWMRRRRAEILGRHRCPCGQPATRIAADPGTGKVTWSWAEERIETLLAGKRLRCDSCPDGERRGVYTAEERAERQRESNRRSMARKRAAAKQAPTPPPLAQERPARADTVTGRVKAAAAPKANQGPATVFDDPAWREERRAARMARRRALGMTAEPDDDADEDDEVVVQAVRVGRLADCESP